MNDEVMPVGTQRRLAELEQEVERLRELGVGYSQHTMNAVVREREELRAEVERLRALIADDAHAMTFQSLGQYRSALLRAIKEGQR